MDLIRRISFVMITLSLLNLLGCKTPDDSGSMQPIEGYPFLTSIEEIKGILKYRGLDTIEFRKGETIADIGAGNGYIEAMLSMFHDSLTFYIQDIDTSVCNQSAINEVVDFYQEVNGRPFTNKFIVVNGTDTDTNLPDSTFDKILMLWTYSYLKEPWAFIKDVRNNLKDDGLFYVINPQQDEDEYTKSVRQKYGWNASPLEKQITDIIECGFELRRISRNYDVDGYNQPYIMVFKKNTD
jgi:SAM-dependent methyltransferase